LPVLEKVSTDDLINLSYNAKLTYRKITYPGLDNQPTGHGESLSDFPQKGV
jgi:hypothetical protein